MEFKGTKGKWELDGELTDNLSPIEVFNGEKTIAKIVAYEFWNVPIEECNANAKLIASAPEMFAILKSLDIVNHEIPKWLTAEIHELLTKITQ